MKPDVAVTHTDAVSSGVGVVRPDVSELIALRARVAGLRRRGRRGAEASGTLHAPMRGRGMDYAESREYIPGDDARHIDWRLSARTGRAHSKVFHAERERLTCVMIDASPALFFGSRVRFKSVQAARVAAAALWMAARDGDRVMACPAWDPASGTRAASGVRGVMPALHAICGWLQRPHARLEGQVSRVAALRSLLRPGSRFWMVGDANALAPTVRDAAMLLPNVDLHLLAMVDAFELDPPAARVPLVGDKASTPVDFSDPAVRQSWRTRHTGACQALDQDPALQHLHVHTLLTDADPVAWLGDMRPREVDVA